jgi:DNA-binding response OmpR family regulator
VLELLEARRGRAISRDELLGEVWGRGQETSNVVDAVVRGLRKKLGDQADLVETVRGVGYRLRE